MIMQGGLHMVNFRKVAVFIGVVGLLFGIASMGDAAHTKAHRQATADPEMRGGPGKPEMILQGPVLNVSPATGFIVIRHGAGRDAEEIPVEIDSKTTLMKAGKRASLDEIKVGDRVKVRYSGQVGDVTKMVDVMAGAAMRRGDRM
jgi:hypothetical protein